MDELIEDCADIPAAVRTSPALPAPRAAEKWRVNDQCLAQVNDLDDYV